MVFPVSYDYKNAASSDGGSSIPHVSTDIFGLFEQVNPDQEPEFPHVELAKLDEMINRPRWVVPVLPRGELEVLLEASIKLSKDGTAFDSLAPAAHAEMVVFLILSVRRCHNCLADCYK